jgi:hypothetical protein
MMMNLVTGPSNSACSELAQTVIERVVKSRDSSALSLSGPVGWEHYLGRMTRARRLGEDHAEELRHFWSLAFSRLGPALPEPLTQPTSEGAWQLAWGAGRHYVEVDVYPDGSLEWFYRDREAGAVEGTADGPIQRPPPELFEKIRLAAGLR